MINIEEWVVQAKAAIEQSFDLETLELVRIKFLGKKGYVTKQSHQLRYLAPEERATTGLRINQAKHTVKQALANRKHIITALKARVATDTIDVSLPGRRIAANGGIHPISRTIARLEYFFNQLGFAVITGSEIEDEYHNFAALNMPANHPARTDHDTFWLDNTRLLRTQTSSVQIRTLKKQKPPIRMITSGRVYRKDDDSIHTPMFHQMEGLIIDTNISFTNLKGTLYELLLLFFEHQYQIRFRPSYFPFTEPSAEIDLMDLNGRWLEVLGCGMVHPNVLRKVGINQEHYSGFAFGIGIERLAMLRYNVTDLREFFHNDLRFLKQLK